MAVGLPRAHGEPANVPVPLLVKLTVPVGALVVPGEVSVTVAVQLVAEFTATDDGEQLTAVVVVRVVTVTANVPELPRWFVSLP